MGNLIIVLKYYGNNFEFVLLKTIKSITKDAACLEKSSGRYIYDCSNVDLEDWDVYD